MGIFSRIFKGHQPEQYHIDPDRYESFDGDNNSTGTEAGANAETGVGANSNKFEVSQQPIPETPNFAEAGKNENIQQVESVNNGKRYEVLQPLVPDKAEAKQGRMSMEQIIALGAQRAEEARAEAEADDVNAGRRPS